MRERLKSALHKKPDINSNGNCPPHSDNVSGSQTSLNSDQASKVSKFFSLKSVLGKTSLSGSLAGSITSLNNQENTPSEIKQEHQTSTLDRRVAKGSKSLLKRSNSLRADSGHQRPEANNRNNSVLNRVNSAGAVKGVVVGSETGLSNGNNKGGGTNGNQGAVSTHNNGIIEGQKGGSSSSWRSPGRFLFSSKRDQPQSPSDNVDKVSNSNQVISNEVKQKNSKSTLSSKKCIKTNVFEGGIYESVAFEKASQDHDQATRPEMGDKASGRKPMRNDTGTSQEVKNNSRLKSNSEIECTSSTTLDLNKARLSMYDNVGITIPEAAQATKPLNNVINSGGFHDKRDQKPSRGKTKTDGCRDDNEVVGNLLAECQSYIETQDTTQHTYTQYTNHYEVPPNQNAQV